MRANAANLKLLVAELALSLVLVGAAAHFTDAKHNNRAGVDWMSERIADFLAHGVRSDGA